MLNTVKQTAPDVYIVPDPFRCTSVDPEAAAQARTFYYKVVRNTKSCTKVLGGDPQNSTKEGELYVYNLLFSPEYTCVLLKYF